MNRLSIVPKPALTTAVPNVPESSSFTEPQSACDLRQPPTVLERLLLENVSSITGLSGRRNGPQ